VRSDRLRVNMVKTLTHEQLRRIREIFDSVSEREADEQAASLAQVCGADAAVLTEVERLLLAHRQTANFLETPPLVDSARFRQGDWEEIVEGRRIGPYELRREIGHGGMSAVYLAERADDVIRKQVAIKLVWPGLSGAEIERRFRQERQILANFDHPNIARLLDAGTTEDGWPYVVMEYIDGLPITDYCTERKFSIKERLKLFQDVCAAVQFAHQNLVVHRDLKPSNILVTAEGAVKLLDFGIAKLLGPERHPEALTRDGLYLMTPEYASPEQIRGAETTTASDIYSLGVVLYELLTGERPYQLKGLAPYEAPQVVCESEVERPSARVARSVKAGESFAERDSAKLRRNLSGDLDKIALKALGKDPRNRYSSAALLSEDIRRHLAGEPVEARPQTFVPRAARFIKRYKLLVASTLVVVLTLVGGILASQRQKRRAEALAWQNRQLLYAAQISLAQQALKEGNIRRAHELLEQQKPRPGEPDLRGFEWRYLQRLAHQELATLENGSEVQAMAFSPDGRVLAAGCRDGIVRVWDVAKRELLLPLSGHTAAVWSVTFTPDNKKLVSGSSDRTIRLWNVGSGQTEYSFTGHTDAVRGTVITPDGQTMISVSDDRTIRKWDLRARRSLPPIEAHNDSINAIALSPDGRAFATCSSDSTAKLWDLKSGRLLLTTTVAGEQIRSLAFSPDGRTIALATTGDSINLWDLTEGAQISAFTTREISWSVAFAPSGQKLAAGSFAHTATLWDVATRRELTRLPGHIDRVYAVAFSPDERILATASKDGTVKLWDPQHTGNGLTLHSTLSGGISWASALSPDGKYFAAGNDDQIIKIWDVRTWREVKTIDCRCNKVRAVAYSPDGRYVVTGGIDKIIRVWDVDSGQPVKSMPGHTNQIRSLAFSPDGKLLASASEDHTARLWEVATGREWQVISDLNDKVRAVTFSPDGQILVAAGDDPQIIFWSVPDRKKKFALPTRFSRMYASNGTNTISYSPDGKTLATAGSDYNAHLWDARTYRKIVSFTGHANNIWGLAFSHDGRRLATAGGDRTIRIWDVNNGYELLAIDFPGAARSLVFTHDDNNLIVTGDSGLVMVFGDGFNPEKAVRGH